MKVPINLRSHERKQLDEFITRAIDLLEDRGLDEEAEDVREATIIEDEGANTYSAEPSDWSAVIGSLRILRPEESLRSWWLRKKLAKRLSRRMDEIEDAEGEGVESDDSDGSDPNPRADECGIQEVTA